MKISLIKFKITKKIVESFKKN